MTAVKKRDRKLAFIAVDKIVPNERNPRSAPQFSQDDPEFRQLQKSIENLGILEPIIVQTYEQGMYLLVEGERRWTVAKNLGIVEVPALIQNKLGEDEQVVVMYNLHENRKGWEMADHLRAIQTLQKAHPTWTPEELANELGMRIGTLKDRLRVLGMGEQTVHKIATGKLDYTSALRSTQTAANLKRVRPELVAKLGGEKMVEKALIKKAEVLGGTSHELTAGKQDLIDTKHVPDALIEEYVNKPEKTLKQVRQSHQPAVEKRQVSDLRKDVTGIEARIKSFSANLDSAPDLRKLRSELVRLIEVAEQLERRIVEAILEAEEEPVKPGRGGSKRVSDTERAEQKIAAQNE